MDENAHFQKEDRPEVASFTAAFPVPPPLEGCLLATSPDLVERQEDKGVFLVLLSSVQQDQLVTAIRLDAPLSINGGEGEKLMRFGGIDDKNRFVLSDSPEAPVVYCGGLDSTDLMYCIHSGDYNEEFHTQSLNENGVFYTGSLRVLKEIAANKGPRRFLIGNGFCKWPRDLFVNLIRIQAWLVLRAEPDLIFSGSHADLWDRTIARYNEPRRPPLHTTYAFRSFSGPFPSLQKH